MSHLFLNVYCCLSKLVSQDSSLKWFSLQQTLDVCSAIKLTNKNVIIPETWYLLFWKFQFLKILFLKNNFTSGRFSNPTSKFLKFESFCSILICKKQAPRRFLWKEGKPSIKKNTFLCTILKFSAFLSKPGRPSQGFLNQSSVTKLSHDWNTKLWLV